MKKDSDSIDVGLDDQDMSPELSRPAVNYKIVEGPAELPLGMFDYNTKR